MTITINEVLNNVSITEQNSTAVLLSPQTTITIDDETSQILISGASNNISINDIINNISVSGQTQTLILSEQVGGGGSGNSYFPSGW